MKQKLEVQVKKAVEAQAKYYKAKHQQQKYNVEDKIFLNSRNIKSTQPSKKLDLKYYGLYKVITPIGKQTYRLALSSSMKIYNASHILLLEPCDTKDKTPSPPPINVEKEEEYEVEKILDRCIHYEKLQYLIKWLGYLHMDNQWTALKDVSGALKLVSIYHRLYSNKPNATLPKKRANSAKKMAAPKC